ncbi:MAG TPA: glycosyltransferase family 4 protein [Pirellulales bacterium]
MRVAWLFEYPTMNGGERSLLATLPALRRAEIQSVALAPASGDLAAELARQGVELAAFELFDGGQRRSRDELRGALTARLQSLGPALLHANSLSMGRLSGPVAQALRMPSIAHLRDIVRLNQAAVADLNCHTRLLAVSRATRDSHLRQGIDGQRTEVCHNGVDLGQFRPQTAGGWLHQRLNLPPRAVLIGSIGQIILRKGQDILIRAAARLQPHFPDLHWLLVGDRHSPKAETVEYEAALHAAVREHRLTERVHFLGTLTAVERLLPELTLLVHTARQEPLGRVLLEAAAGGVPCVATDVGGTGEVFPTPEQARLVPVNDDIALATAVRELLLSSQERQEMARAARRHVEQCFDAQTAGDRLAEHYRQVIAMCPGRGADFTSRGQQ